jgi:hypothetical protein
MYDPLSSWWYFWTGNIFEKDTLLSFYHDTCMWACSFSVFKSSLFVFVICRRVSIFQIIETDLVGSSHPCFFTLSWCCGWEWFLWLFPMTIHWINFTKAPLSSATSRRPGQEITGGEGDTWWVKGDTRWQGTSHRWDMYVCVSLSVVCVFLWNVYVCNLSPGQS